MQIIELITKARVSKGLSKAKLCKNARAKNKNAPGVKTLIAWERGKNKPSEEKAWVLADYLGMSWDDFIKALNS